MISIAQKQDKNCEECYKIKCKNCDWEPDNSEVELLNHGILTKCPDCSSGK